MIYRHKKTGGLYRFLFPTWDKTNEKTWAVYIGLANGVIYSRDGDDFSEKFEFVEYSQTKEYEETNEKHED